MNKKINERIEELEKKHRFLDDTQLDAVWVIDAATLKYEYITPAIERISGYTADEYMNLTIADTLTPESLRKVTAVFAEERKRFEQGIRALRTLELVLLRKDGGTYWGEIRARFLKEQGECLKIVGVTKEITDRKKAEEKHNELIKRLGEALAEKERLLAEVKVLRDLLPICCGCKRIRDEDGKWWPLDAYVRNRTDSEITHTICPDCTEVLYET